MNLYEIYSTSYNGITQYIEAESILIAIEIFNNLHKDRFVKPSIDSIRVLGVVHRAVECQD